MSNNKRLFLRTIREDGYGETVQPEYGRPESKDYQIPLDGLSGTKLDQPSYCNALYAYNEYFASLPSTLVEPSYAAKIGVGNFFEDWEWGYQNYNSHWANDGWRNCSEDYYKGIVDENNRRIVLIQQSEPQTQANQPSIVPATDWLIDKSKDKKPSERKYSFYEVVELLTEFVAANHVASNTGMREVLQELVTLKIIKDELDEGIDIDRTDDYKSRKVKAWDAAKKILVSESPSSPSSNTWMKWVKASERLPENKKVMGCIYSCNGFYYCKCQNDAVDVCQFKSEWGEFRHITIGCDCQPYKEEKANVIEWLDESSHSASGEELAKAIEKVVENIFYSPATNGKAKESIAKGVEAVKLLLAGFAAGKGQFEFTEWVGSEPGQFVFKDGKWTQVWGDGRTWTTQQLYEMFEKYKQSVFYKNKTNV